jgi:hypothetical protein
MDDFVPVPGFEGLYEVSRGGVVRSLLRTVVRGNGTVQVFQPKVLSQFLSDKGYPCVSLKNDSCGKSRVYRVHRLLATAFIENPIKHPEVNHLDGNKANNSIENLEWTTPSGNRKHAWDTGLRDRRHLPYVQGERVGTSKLTNEKVLYARQLRKDGYSYSQIAAKIGVTKMPARLAVNGITWSHVLPPNPE